MVAAKQEPPYLALIGDIRGSREIEDRAELQERFQAALDTAQRGFFPETGGVLPGAPLSGPTITTGDEFQALFPGPSGVVAFVVDVSEALHPVQARFGLGYGGLDTPVNEEAAIGMDGPCFHRARSSLQQATHEDRWIRVRGFGAFDDAINALFDLLASARGSWTDRQRELAEAYRKLGVQQEVAERFGIAKSTISESLKAGHVHEVLGAERALSDLLVHVSSEEDAGVPA